MAMGSANYRSVLKDIWGSKGVGGLYQVLRSAGPSSAAPNAQHQAHNHAVAGVLLCGLGKARKGSTDTPLPRRYDDSILDQDQPVNHDDSTTGSCCASYTSAESDWVSARVHLQKPQHIHLSHAGPSSPG